ncbi:MAG: hypothetical protein Q4G50_00930 [Corynebacterium sp.]|uniref:hypothetical protein n=1 Tax=Corynebacterium sp. TaxID=1720 RepID=UPI0026E0EE5C|nr:hypothetical protein [Corynebacterium sp.]MDO5668545.1 hypothetical protein [Corynebacterium sp.]
MNLREQIPQVTRRVLIDAPSHTVGVELTRSFAASGRELWEAITDPHRLEHWFGDIDPAELQVEACEEERLLRLPWEGGTLQVTLADNALTLTYTTPHDADWDTFGPALLGVEWDSALAALNLYLAADAESEAGEEEAFMRAVVGEWSVDKQQAQRTINLFLE